eukprot:jgi/Botrbrau1/13302/Bobra.27_2s0021.1
MDNVVVLDLGSQFLKAGTPYNFPTDPEPRVVSPTAVVAPKAVTASPTSVVDEMDGNEGIQRLNEKSDGTRVVRPIQRGVITNWDALESLLYDTLYTQLGWRPGDEGNVFIAEPLFMSKAERERLTHMFFEDLVVNGFYMLESPVLSLYSVGKMSGCVVDIGYSKIDVSTVVEGQTYQPSTRRIDFGCADLNVYLAQLLEKRGIAVADPALLEPVKEACIHVVEKASQLEEELEKATEVKPFTLADGQTITIVKEGLLLGEALVNPSIVDPELHSMPSVIVNACMCHADAGFRKAALEAILICGGGSCVPGLSARLLAEMKELCPPSVLPALLTVPEYMPENTLRYSVWMGGAIVSKGVFQQNQHISRGDYDEAGPSMVNRKCC